MKVQLVEKDIKDKEQRLSNLKYSLRYLELEEKSHVEAINLVSYEIFYLKDQLGNYRILLDILKEEESNAEMPKEV